MNIYQLCDSARQDTPRQFYESQVRSRCSVAVAAHDKTGQITAIAILIASELFLFAVCLLLFRRANAPSDSGPSESLSFQISWRSKTWREKTVAACLHAIVFTNNYLSVGLFRRVFLIVLAAARWFHLPRHILHARPEPPAQFCVDCRVAVLRCCSCQLLPSRKYQRNPCLRASTGYVSPTLPIPALS